MNIQHTLFGLSKACQGSSNEREPQAHASPTAPALAALTLFLPLKSFAAADGWSGALPNKAGGAGIWHALRCSSSCQ